MRYATELWTTNPLAMKLGCPAVRLDGDDFVPVDVRCREHPQLNVIAQLRDDQERPSTDASASIRRHHCLSSDLVPGETSSLPRLVDELPRLRREDVHVRVRSWKAGDDLLQTPVFRADELVSDRMRERSNWSGTTHAQVPSREDLAVARPPLLANPRDHAEPEQ